MIILPTERKTFRARLILAVIYLVLALGALTMVWPFLMMVAGSMSGRFDYDRHSPLLTSVWTPEGRFVRVLSSFHPAFPKNTFPNAPADWTAWSAIAEDPEAIRAFARPWIDGMDDPATAAAWRTMAQDYADFNRTYNVRNSVCSYDERDVAPYVRATFEAKTGHQSEQAALDELNRTWDIRYNSFHAIRFRAQSRVPLHYPDWDWPDDPKTALWQAFKAHCRDVPYPYARTRPYRLAPRWTRWRAQRNLAPAPFPGDDADPAWREFVTTAYPRRLLRVRINQETQADWIRFVQAQIRSPADYERLTGQTAPHRLADIPLKPYDNTPLWRAFVATLPYDALIATSAEADWQAFLKARYRTLDALNAAYRDAHGAPYAATDWRDVPLPLAQAYAVTFADHGAALLWQDITASYRTVVDALFLRGRAWWNTLVLVLLTILATLTVNPLAAYALSRFRLPHTEGILLFLLATMAFPAAVTAIPGFLLIRELGLLNTFAALVLPTVANGLSIFVLKGFFDALPRELYEAATIDGASEWQIFRHITLPMTTPILAVNALNAFIAAYNSWEWALLVCQRQSHWTLSVWLYQMSQTYAGTPWVTLAGFVLVSIPTALVFLLCQRVILRGIVLPSMK